MDAPLHSDYCKNSFLSFFFFLAVQFLPATNYNSYYRVLPFGADAVMEKVLSLEEWTQDYT